MHVSLNTHGIRVRAGKCGLRVCVRCGRLSVCPCGCYKDGRLTRSRGRERVTEVTGPPMCVLIDVRKLGAC